MIRRRTIYDPLRPSQDPRWLVVRNMHGGQLEARPIEPGADLKRVFIPAMLEWLDAGWHVGELGSLCASVAIKRDGEQRTVNVEFIDPKEPPRFGASHLAGG